MLALKVSYLNKFMLQVQLLLTGLLSLLEFAPMLRNNLQQKLQLILMRQRPIKLLD